MQLLATSSYKTSAASISSGNGRPRIVVLGLDVGRRVSTGGMHIDA
jgi:hypothetical protein